MLQLGGNARDSLCFENFKFCDVHSSFPVCHALLQLGQNVSNAKMHWQTSDAKCTVQLKGRTAHAAVHCRVRLRCCSCSIVHFKKQAQLASHLRRVNSLCQRADLIGRQRERAIELGSCGV